LATGSSWEVCDTYTGSDHAGIICSIWARIGPSRLPKTVTGYTTETLDVEIVQMLFEGFSASDLGEYPASLISDYIKLACNAAIHRKERTHSEVLYSGGTKI